MTWGGTKGIGSRRLVEGGWGGEGMFLLISGRGVENPSER